MSRLSPYIKRFLIVFILSTAFVVIFNEVTYLLQGDERARQPKTIQIIIPARTAEKIAAGGSEPSIPEGMTFVVGDTLTVRNEDNVDHQLGPLWVPAGRSSSLKLVKADKLSYQCSFSISNYFDLDIVEPTTLGVRIIAILLAAPTMAMLVFIYSLAALPIHRSKQSV